MPNRAGPPPVQNSNLTAVQNRLGEVVSLMQARNDQFASLLGQEHAERWRTVALHALAQNKNVLQNCTALSIVEAIRESATLNLQPTGLLGEGWILPYGDKAQFMPGYRGYLKLLRNSGQIKTVDCQLVYMADDFRIEFGTEPKIHHVPALYGEKNDDGEYLADRGEYRGAYAWVRLTTGELVIEWMTWDDIEVVRRKSPSVQRGRQSPWDDFPGEMARKSVLRRLIKRLPLETMPTVAHAATLDEEADVVEGTATDVTPSSVTRATAAAYALSRGGTDEPSEAQGTSEVGTVEEPVALMEQSAPEPPAPFCRDESPYGDGQSCTKDAGHPGNHRGGDGSTW